MKLSKLFSATTTVLAIAISTNAMAEDLAVGITRSMQKFEGTVNGEKVTIMRNQDQKANVNPAFAKTSRACPPFCIQPSELATGVETIGELEVIE